MEKVISFANESNPYTYTKTFIYGSVFFIFYILFLNQGLKSEGPLGPFASETYHHIEYSFPFLHQNWLDLLRKDFEPLVHILTAVAAWFFDRISHNSEYMNLINGSAAILALAKLFQFYLIKKIIEESLSVRENEVWFLTIIANIATALYLPFITLNIFVPLGSPNVLVDPTNILLQPFAILFFYLYLKHFFKLTSTFSKGSIGLSALLLTATLIKPAFTNVMVLVMAVIYLLNIRRFMTKNLIHDLIIFLPSCLLMIYQMILISELNLGSMIFAPYRLINQYTTHPFTALFQAIEFPMLITFVSALTFSRANNGFKLKDFVKSNISLSCAWLFTIIAYLIFALFTLSGPTELAGNLGWSYQIALGLLYPYTIIEYARIKETVGTQNKRSLWLDLCTLNLCLVFLSGLNQFIKVYLGGSFL